jgi:hypothetical protein
MGQDLRKVNPDGSSHSPDEIQTILTEELKKHQQQGDGITNPLFDMDGELPPLKIDTAPLTNIRD